MGAPLSRHDALLERVIRDLQAVPPARLAQPARWQESTRADRAPRRVISWRVSAGGFTAAAVAVVGPAGQPGGGQCVADLR
jgi:hypothetical protein